MCFKCGMIDGLTIEECGCERREFSDRLHSLVGQKLNSINEQREEILEAFVAKYGFQPDECEQVYEETLNGFKWSVRKKLNANSASEAPAI